MRALKILGLFYIFVFLATILILSFTEGHFTYGLDDAYIHLALAKHFVQDGMWGVTPHEPSACSSSIIWPFLLSGCIYIFGLNPMIPFYLSLVIATGFLLWLNRTIGKTLPNDTGKGSLILFILFSSCIASIIFVGMEHVLQVWMCSWFAYHAAVVLSKPSPTFNKAWPLIILAPIMTSTRYEGLSLVAVVCVMLTLRNGIRHMFGKGFLIGCVVCLSGLLPVVVFGYAMHRLDLPFLPYSVQLKAWAPSVAFFSGIWLHLGPKFILNCIAHPELFFLLTASLYTLRHHRKQGAPFWTIPSVLQVIFAVACVLHLEFAISGPYARYIAYLTTLGILALGLDAGPIFHNCFRLFPWPTKQGTFRRFLAVGTMVTILFWAILSHVAIPFRARNIYQQQIQMARFLKEYYDGQAVALNDIGTSSFKTNIKMVDIFGLASKEVAETRLHGNYGINDIDRITKENSVQVALIYKNWFKTSQGSILPPHWECVGEWTIPLNLTCGWHTVSIFAVDSSAKESLVDHLINFSPELPKAVIQSGIYTDNL